VEFGLLGPLLVRDDSRDIAVSAPRQRVLLAALLLAGAGRPVAFDELGALLWDGRPPASARGALHSAVQRLRVTLGAAGPDLVRTCPSGYLIDIGPDALDVHRFEALAGQGEAAAEDGLRLCCATGRRSIWPNGGCGPCRRASTLTSTWAGTRRSYRN
jgi:DNA-binding SARP family transcriptional activator